MLQWDVCGLIPSSILYTYLRRYGFSWLTCTLVIKFLPWLWVLVRILFGIKGNKWAWHNKKWPSLESFQESQKRWTIAGFTLIVGLVMVSALVIGILVYSIYPLQSSINQQALAIVNQSKEAKALLGEPIKISLLPTSGSTIFSIKGSINQGVIELKMSKNNNKWTVNEEIISAANKHIHTVKK
ncbi:MAG: cytochrome c oxidase assembly factor Coa1 family protein [Gammaproteobacteria bacterium]